MHKRASLWLRPVLTFVLPLILVAGCAEQAGSAPLTSAASSEFATTATSPTSTPSDGATQVDPANWSNDLLAAELVFAAARMPDLPNAVSWAKAGIAGFVLLDNPGRNLKDQLAKIRAASPGARLMIGSDEEGGEVQRLTSLLWPLPSAATIGQTMNPAQAQDLALRYGGAMKALGVNVSFAPDSDIAVPGAFIAQQGRAFNSNPGTVSKYVTAWQAGLRTAGVMGVLKHWPGHGSSTDTHVGSGTTPEWSSMKARDLVPFDAGVADGACAVMVGHLIVPGLTEADVPASMSPAALRVLRADIGPNRLILTDSVAMGAVTESMGQTQTQAAVRSLVAGADVALLKTSDPLAVVKGIAGAIRFGELPHDQAVASARRVLAAASQWSMTSKPGSHCQ